MLANRASGSPVTMQDMSEHGLRAAEEKMRAAGHHDEAISNFRSAYERVDSGESAVIRSDELEPAQKVSSLDELGDQRDASALDRFVTIKLNGGLATTMGLRE